MIRIALPEAPAVLLTEGIKRTRTDCEAYDADPDQFLSANFIVDRSIYGASEVKRALMEAQFNKCCYCESKLGATSPGDIEHYRPKKRVRQDMSTREEKQGYYWLVYSWDNLLVACEKCNREHKRTQFPLATPERRARCHHDNIDDEVPLLIHPALEDPRMHIRFRKDAPEGLTHAGATTIRVLGLANRAELVDIRLKQFKRLARLLEWYKISKQSTDPMVTELHAEVRRALEEEMTPDNEFSAMTMDLLETTFE